MKFEDYRGYDSVEKAKKLYAEWMSEYDDIYENYPECEEIVGVLRKRLERVLEIFVDRNTPRPSAGIGGHDDSYYDWLDEIKEKEDATLDGDFPLGNERDAEFAGCFFNIHELALIQCGLHHMVSSGRYDDRSPDVLARRGFICELYEDWDMAAASYAEVGTSEAVQKRETFCREKMVEAGEAAYAEAQKYMQSGEWSRVFHPLQRAANMKNTDGMVDLALARIYGQYGLATDMYEALELLREAADKGNARACFELVEIHDNGYYSVDGSEAKKMCEMAASLGHLGAIERLYSGFDTRPTHEIMEEQVERGNIDALWSLVLWYQVEGDDEKAREWFDRALESGQTDALLRAAEICLDKDGESYNEKLAKMHLRRAADAGSIRAIIAIGELELEDTKEHFWHTAMKMSEDGRPSERIVKQHTREFGWYKLAAEAGDGDAMNCLCVAYHFGYPVERDDTVAFKWIEKAVEAGNTSAMYQAAYLLENGFGTKKDIDRAVELYTESAESGIISSMLRLYEIYRDGLEHIPADKQKSLQYLWMSGVGHT